MRHFYSVYDFDKDQIGLGINKHSEGRVALYKPGERPADSQAAETAAVDVTSGDEEAVAVPSASAHQSSASSDLSTSSKSQLQAASSS